MSLLELLGSLAPAARSWIAGTFGSEEARVSERVAAMAEDLLAGVHGGAGSRAAGATDDAFWIPLLAGKAAFGKTRLLLRSPLDTTSTLVPESTSAGTPRGPEAGLPLLESLDPPGWLPRL